MYFLRDGQVIGRGACRTCRGAGLERKASPFALYRGMMITPLVGAMYLLLLAADLPSSAIAAVGVGLGAIFVGGVVGEGAKRYRLRKARELTQLPPRGP
jgi:hypothetical protein